MEALKTLSYWLLFSLLMSLAPMALNVYLLQSSSGNLLFSDAIVSVLSGGELLILCLALLGASIGELFRNADRNRILPVWVLGLAVLIFMFAAGFFVDMSGAKISGNVKGRDDVLIMSFGVLFTSTMICISSILITSSTNR